MPTAGAPPGPSRPTEMLRRESMSLRCVAPPSGWQQAEQTTVRLASPQLDEIGNQPRRLIRQRPCLQRRGAYPARIAKKSHQALGQERLRRLQLRCEGWNFDPAKSRAGRMLHQHFASFPRQQESVVNQRVEVFDVMKRAIDLAVETARRRFAETSIAQPVEIDWSIRIGGKKEGIHWRYNAVASVDISRHALLPRDQLVAEELAYLQARWFIHRSQPLGSGQRSVMLISAACIASASPATNGATACPLTH
jgi:hypothetical protein